MYPEYWGYGADGSSDPPRVLMEQCDNGGLTKHGCDRLCQIDPLYECRHFYRSIGANYETDANDPYNY